MVNLLKQPDWTQNKIFLLRVTFSILLPHTRPILLLNIYVFLISLFVDYTYISILCFRLRTDKFVSQINQNNFHTVRSKSWHRTYRVCVCRVHVSVYFILYKRWKFIKLILFYSKEGRNYKNFGAFKYKSIGFWKKTRCSNIYDKQLYGYDLFWTRKKYNNPITSQHYHVSHLQNTIKLQLVLKNCKRRAEVCRFNPYV